MLSQHLPLERSLVFSFVLAADVGNVLKDELPVGDPYHTKASDPSPRNEGGSPTEETHTHTCR